MNCNDVIRELSNYLDGDLDLALKQDLERHLGECKECTVVVDQTRKTVELFCDSEPAALPSDIQSRLHDALRRKISRQAS